MSSSVRATVRRTSASTACVTVLRARAPARRPRSPRPPPRRQSADRLDERRDAERLLDPRRGVAHAELDRRVERVRPQVPPDLLSVVDALRADHELDVVLELVVRGEVRRDAGAREPLPDDLPIRL